MELHVDYERDWQFVNRGSERLFAEVWEACEHAVKEIEEFYPSCETNMLMSEACHYQTEPVWNKRQARRRIRFITNWANEMKSNYEKSGYKDNIFIRLSAAFVALKMDSALMESDIWLKDLVRAN